MEKARNCARTSSAVRALRELADHVGRYDLARSLALADQGIEVASLDNLAYEGALCRLERARSLRLLGEYAEAKATLEGLPAIFLDAGDDPPPDWRSRPRPPPTLTSANCKKRSMPTKRRLRSSMPVATR